MDRREQRKQKKKHARVRALNQKREIQTRAKAKAIRQSEYPSIHIDFGPISDPKIVETIRNAVQRVDFTDFTRFSQIERRYYKVLKSDPIHAIDILREFSMSAHDRESFHILATLILNLGQQIYSNIPIEHLQQWIPYYDFSVLQTGNSLQLKCRALEQTKTVGGTCFYSRLKPEIEFNGKKYVIGFSRHAIDRICTRLKPNRIEYGHSGDLAGFFHECVYAEPVDIYPDSPGFLIYDYCTQPGAVQFELYVKKILGIENLNWDGGLPYYRLGYCPVTLDGDFAKAKTFLCPGHKGTPEYGLLAKSRTLPPDILDRFKERSTASEASIETLTSGEFEHLKWFHDSGIPQVVQMEQLVFKYDDQPPLRIIDNAALRAWRESLETNG